MIIIIIIVIGAVITVLFLFRLKIAKGVIVNKLFIKVNASDSSYMPEKVAVIGCYSSAGKQHTLKETTIPSYAVFNNLLIDV